MSTKTFIEPRMVKKPPFTVEVPGVAPVHGETIPRRNPVSVDKLLSQPEKGINTLFDILQYSAANFGDKKALGFRKLVATHKETTKVKKVIDGKLHDVEKDWTYFELSGYNYLSYRQFETLALQIGAGLRKLGMTPHDRVHMFASTSHHWLSVAHGAMSQSMAVVTSYDTLGEEGLRHSLVATRAKAIFLEPHLLKTFSATLKDARSIQYIVVNIENKHDLSQIDLDSLQRTRKPITTLGFEELRKRGESNPIDATPPLPDHLCCIMYTSGTLGPPKGVELKHKHVVASIAGINSIVGHHLSPVDSVLTYLPLAHIFEFVFENSCLYWGAVMGYGSVRTLSQANCRNCKGDIQEFKPTLLVGIPAVWEKVRKGVIANVNKASRLARLAFWSSLIIKRFLTSNGLPGSWLLDKLVFSKLKEATGGRLRLCLNGGAPIARDTQEFISLTICPMVSGYGITETAANGALCDPAAWTIDAHGDLPSSIEIKLVDFPEAGYYAVNQPNAQGEIWIRGTSVMERYYNNEKLTEEAMAPGGWFKTGDIGEWDKNGHLKVIDRKKNLVKTLNGEYIALEKLETVYLSANIVLNVCIYASAYERKPVAIIVPDEVALKSLASNIGIEGHGIGDLVHHKAVESEIFKQLQAVGKSSGLAEIEMIQWVVLSDEEWTAQNEMITATNKLNRKRIIDRYRENIETIYRKR